MLDTGSNNGQEASRKLRTAIELKVEYKRLNAFFADYTTNISKGGTFIATDEPMDLGTEFTFNLAVPGVEEAISINGVVRWIIGKESTDERGPGMGIEFLYKDEKDRRRVETMVEKLMVEQLGKEVYDALILQCKKDQEGSNK